MWAESGIIHRLNLDAPLEAGAAAGDDLMGGRRTLTVDVHMEEEEEDQSAAADLLPLCLKPEGNVY